MGTRRRHRRTGALAALSLATLLPGTVPAAAESPAPLQTVVEVDLDRYLGTWHEVARYPNRFQRNCEHATAEYSLRDDGRIRVVNTCTQTTDGGVRQVDGVAEIADRDSRAKLRVSFLPAWLRWTGIGRGDYWIIDLDDDYGWAVVGEPGRRYLWILARQPALPADALAGILERLRAQGYEPEKLLPPPTEIPVNDGR